MDNILNTIRIRRHEKVRNPRSVRITAGLQVVVGLLLFLLLLRPDWLPQWGYWGLFALSAALSLCEMAFDYRRRRPRRRWRDAGLALLSLSVVWIVIMPLFIFAEMPDDRETAYALLGTGVVSLVLGVVCLLRWRRLRARAEMRLWELKAERRKRGVLRARAAAEGGGAL